MTVSLSRLFSFSSVYSKAMPLPPDIPVPDYTRKQQFLRTERPAASVRMPMPLAADSGLWRMALFQCLSGSLDSMLSARTAFRAPILGGMTYQYGRP